MLCFEVRVNGRKLCRAGVGKKGVLTAVVTWVGGAPRARRRGGRTVKGETTLHVGGLYNSGRRQVFPDWTQQRPLSNGDEVTIRVFRARTADRPKSQRVQTRDWIEKEQRAHYEQMKLKYEKKK